jgi:serine phosphatase RsbU (regulator of sigma subunit)
MNEPAGASVQSSGDQAGENRNAGDGAGRSDARLNGLVLEQQALEQDLAMAQEVQRSLLPQGVPQFGDYDFATFYQPARRVGGDYYDFVPLADGRLVVILADAAGKGIPAALLMMALSGMLKASLAREPVSEAVRQANRWLCSSDSVGRFVTMLVVVLDPVSEETIVVNAGHFEPLVRHADGVIEALGEDDISLPLGVQEDERYRETSVRLRPGEFVTLYTDGIIDAMNEAGVRYDQSRLVKVLKGEFQRSGQIAARIIADVRKHVRDWWQTDDMSLVCIGRP